MVKVALELQSIHFSGISDRNVTPSEKSASAFSADLWSDGYAALHSVMVYQDFEWMSEIRHETMELILSAVRIYDYVRQEFAGAALIDGYYVKMAARPQMFRKYLKNIEVNPSDQIAMECFYVFMDHFRIMAGRLDDKLAEVENLIRDNAKRILYSINHNGYPNSLSEQLRFGYIWFEGMINAHTKRMLHHFINPMLAIHQELLNLDQDSGRKFDPDNLLQDFKEYQPSAEGETDMLKKDCRMREAAAMEEIGKVYSAAFQGLDMLAGYLRFGKQERSGLSERLSEIRKNFMLARKEQKYLPDIWMKLEELCRLPDILLFFADSGNAEAEAIRGTRTRLAESANAVPADYERYYKDVTEFMDNVKSNYMV